MELHKVSDKLRNKFIQFNAIVFHGDMDQPMFQTEIVKLLRDRFHIHIVLNKDDMGWNYMLYDLLRYKEEFNHMTESFAGYKTFEDAEEAGILNAMFIIKKQLTLKK